MMRLARRASLVVVLLVLASVGIAWAEWVLWRYEVITLGPGIPSSAAWAIDDTADTQASCDGLLAKAVAKSAAELQWVRGEHGEGDGLAEALVARLGQGHRGADQHTLEQRESHAGSTRRRMTPSLTPTAERARYGNGDQSQWGSVYRITTDQNEKTRFENDRRGYRLATSVGGANTGEGGDLIVCDDPHNVREVESDTVRTGVVRWWNEVMSTRGNNPATTRRIVIMQRAHEDDVAGNILAQGGV